MFTTIFWVASSVSSTVRSRVLCYRDSASVPNACFLRVPMRRTERERVLLPLLFGLFLNMQMRACRFRGPFITKPPDQHSRHWTGRALLSTCRRILNGLREISLEPLPATAGILSCLSYEGSCSMKQGFNATADSAQGLQHMRRYSSASIDREA